MQSTTVPALVIRRTLSAPPMRVYEAWTDPKLAQQFLCPDDVTIGSAEMDARTGGTFRIVMKRPAGEDYIAHGTYRDVQPGKRLSMTWIWEEDKPEDEHETLLTLEFKPHGAGTELTLTHEKLASTESRTNHEGGWNQIFNRLEKL